MIDAENREMDGCQRIKSGDPGCGGAADRNDTLSDRGRHTMTIHPRWCPRRMLWGLLALTAACGSHPSAPSTVTPPATAPAPREIVFPSGGLDLHGYLWEPSGRGPFATILYNHGSEKLPGSKPILGAFFTAQGFVFFVPHRRGQGLSPGPYISDIVAQAPAAQRNQVVVDQLDAQADDVAAALTYLLGLPEVDRSRVAVAAVRTAESRHFWL